MDRAPTSPSDAVAAALDWWRIAGVEVPCADDVQAMLADRVETSPTDAPPAAEEAEAQAAEEPLPLLGGDRAQWPEDLAGFAPWWLEEPSLDTGGFHPRIAPRGVAEPALMVLVPMPEADDTETLLSGAQGRLIANIAAALQLDSDALYWASALPRHMPAPGWEDLRQAGLGQIMQHHIALVRPRRLLVFGASILSLLQNGPAQASPLQGKSTILESGMPTLGGPAPDKLLANARARAMLWRRLLDWTEA